MATDVQAIQKLSNFQGDHLSVHMDGGGGAYCRGDVICLFDADMTAADNTLTSATAIFTSADAGKLLKVYNAGLGQFSPHLYGVIKSVTDATTIKVGDSLGADLPAARTVSGARALYGTDFTAHFQALLSAGNSLYIPFGVYGFVGPLIVRPGVRVYGQNKGAGLNERVGADLDFSDVAIGSCLINFSDTDYTFEFLSTSFGDIQDGFIFEGFSLIAKRGFRLNQFGVDILTQAYIHPATFRDLMCTGDYIFTEDPEAYTAVLPVPHGATGNSLDQYGIAFEATKCLRYHIENCSIKDYGIGVLWDGCSHALLGGGKKTRIWQCGVWIYQYGHGVEGNSSGIQNFEFINHSRYGGIFLDGAKGTTFSAGYCENADQGDYPSYCYLYSNNDYQTDLTGVNFLDNYSTTAPTYDMAPSGQLLIHSNQLTIGRTTPFGRIRTDHWTNSGSRATLAKIYGNSPEFPVPDTPGIILSADPDPYWFSYKSPANITGPAVAFIPAGRTTAFPWVISPVTGRWIVNTDSVAFDWYPTIQSPSHRNFRLAVTARKLPLVAYPFVANISYYEFHVNVIGVTNVLPIEIETDTPHGLITGDGVLIKDITVTNFDGARANGNYVVTVVDSTHFTLDGVDGTAAGPYATGGKVYKKNSLGIFPTGITKDTDSETQYILFGLPDGLTTNGILFIEMDTDSAELEELRLIPLTEALVFQGRDGQTDPLVAFRTYDGVEQVTLGVDGRVRLPTSLTGALFKTASYSMLPTDHFIGVSTASGAVTITLPTVASTYDAGKGLGQRVLVKWVSGGNALTIDGNGSEFVENALTYVPTAVGDAVVLQNNGVGWSVISAFTQIGGAWRWVTVNVDIRTDFQVGIGRNPGASKILDVAGIVHADTFRSDNFTASQPIKTNGSKDLISGPIDLANTTNEVSGVLAVANGGTGANTAAGARSSLSVYSIAEIDAIVTTIYAVVAGKATAGTQTGSSAGHTHTQSA